MLSLLTPRAPHPVPLGCVCSFVTDEPNIALRKGMNHALVAENTASADDTGKKTSAAKLAQWPSLAGVGAGLITSLQEGQAVGKATTVARMA